MRGQIAIAVARAIVPEVIRAIQARPTAKPADLAASIMPAAEATAERAMPADVAAVPVKSAMASKVNWIAAASAIIYALAAFGIVIPEEARESVQTLVALGAPALIMVARTWFTKAVTRGSVKG